MALTETTTVLKPQYRKQVEDMAQYALPIFRANGWTYHTSDSIVTLGELVKMLTHLVSTAEQTESGSISSGRFQVERYGAKESRQWSVSMQLGIIDERVVM